MMPKPPSLFLALAFGWCVGALVLIVRGSAGPPEQFTELVITGMVINAVLLASLPVLFRFCLWLRRKQLEGDV